VAVEFGLLEVRDPCMDQSAEEHRTVGAADPAKEAAQVALVALGERAAGCPRDLGTLFLGVDEGQAIECHASRRMYLPFAHRCSSRDHLRVVENGVGHRIGLLWEDVGAPGLGLDLGEEGAADNRWNAQSHHEEAIGDCHRLDPVGANRSADPCSLAPVGEDHRPGYAARAGHIASDLIHVHLQDFAIRPQFQQHSRVSRWVFEFGVVGHSPQ
jgi:hypothetical protein